jgi:integrase
VGQSRKRLGANGRRRYTAYYDDSRGRRRSAGTYATRKDAEIAWQAAEATERAGRPNSSDRGKVSFERYVDGQWFPNHVLEPSTRESYRYCLNRHIVPWFGPMRMRDILPTHVREWVTELSASGVSPAQIRHLKIILSAVFTTALNDFVVVLHPCRGVKTPTVAVKEYRIVTPAEFEALLAGLPSNTTRLFVEVALGTGLRWGELTELRPADLHMPSGIVTVTRAVAEVNPAHHPTGERFIVKPYPKNKRSRRFKLDPELVDAIKAHVAAHGLAPSDLLFQFDTFVGAPAASPQSPRLLPVEQLGLTAPNAAGRLYTHGTLSAYTAGRCRCPHCRSAFANYRAERRAKGLDTPRGTRTRDTDGHLPRDWFRHQVWTPACAAAGLDPRPRLHDLRHSHASWLLAGGADLQVVKERLGHGSIATTGKYLHTLPTADETAIAALRCIRGTS